MSIWEPSNFFKNNLGKRLVLVGVGNLLRGDDAAGLTLVKMIKNAVSIPVVYAEGAIENYIGKIISYNPEVILIIDAAHFNGKPGDFLIFPIDEVPTYLSFNHSFPIELIGKIFKEQKYSNIFILGIQPKNISIGTGLSSEVEVALKKLETLIIENFAK